MKRIFEESGVSDVAVNSRILNVFKKKISVLQTPYRRASKAGGKPLAKLLNGWKTGPKYQFEIYYNEFEVQKVKTQCEILRGQIKNHSHATHLYLRFAEFSSFSSLYQPREFQFHTVGCPFVLSFKHW